MKKRIGFLSCAVLFGALAAFIKSPLSANAATNSSTSEGKTVIAAVANSNVTIPAKSSNDIYNGIKSAFMQGKNFTVKAANKSLIKSVPTIVESVSKDYPELANYSYYSYTYSDTSISYKLSYYFAGSTMAKYNTETYKKAQDLVKALVKPGMTDLEKEISIHDYLVKNNRYDLAAVENPKAYWASYMAYGALVKGTSVCQGYAQAMSLLLRTAGIECKYVSGKGNGGNHAWNIVKIGGQYYHVDATFDDPVFTLNGVRTETLRHTYFNLSDSQMAKDHSWDKTKYPKCNSDKYKFLKVLDEDDVMINNSWIYYKNSSDRESLYKIKLDGTSSAKITSETVGQYYVIKNYVYYTNRTSVPKLYKVDINGKNKVLLKEAKIDNLVVDKGYLYFISRRFDPAIDDEVVELIRLNLSDDYMGTITTDRVEEFIVYGNYLVYTDESDNTSIYRMSLDGKDRKKLNSTSSGHLYVDKDWVYYYNFDDNLSRYKMNINGTGNQKIK